MSISRSVTIASLSVRFFVSCSIWSISREYNLLSVWALRAQTAGPRLALRILFWIAVKSANWPIIPPSASISCTSWLLAGPPIAGLHGCQAILSRLSVNNAVEKPSFAVVIAASQPAWPPPTTMTSKFSLLLFKLLIWLLLIALKYFLFK